MFPKRQLSKLTSVLFVLSITVFALSACDRTAAKRENRQEPVKSPQDNPNNKSTKKSKLNQDKPAKASTVQVTLYFGDELAERLVKEVRKVEATTTIGAAAIEELIEGPKEGGLATMPEGTRLLSLNLREGTATVNMSGEFVDNHPGGSAGERLTVYSIVNTLTEFEEIERVRFLVEGQEVETIAGHMDLTEIIGRDEGLLR